MEDTELLEATADGSDELRIRVLGVVAAGHDIRPQGADIRAVHAAAGAKIS